MAIKGKSKKKGGGKAKAAAPKRPIVPPKPRLFARKAFQVAGASLLAVLLGLVLGWAFWHGSSGQRALTKQESARIAGARGVIDGALVGVGKPAPPADFVAFPDLATGLIQFNQGKMSAKAFAKVAQKASSAAKAAWTQMGGVDVTGIAKGLPSETSGQLKTAQEDLMQALQIYETSSGMLVRAAATSGKDRVSLVSDATTLRTSAAELMTIGYRYYLLVLRAAGLQPASSGVPPGISGLPQGLPGGQNPLPQGLPPVAPSP